MNDWSPDINTFLAQMFGPEKIIRKPQPAAHEPWKPKYDGEEPPF